MKNFHFNEIFEQIINHPEMARHGKEIVCKKGEHIFVQGEVCKDIFCMQSGLVKLYYNTLEGKEWIKSFIADQGIIGSRTSQTLNLPSPFSGLCLENTVMIRFPYDLFESVCVSDPKIAENLFQFTQWLGLKKELREHQLLCQTAEEAFVDFRQSNAGLVDRLTQIDIARYLGITPIALSRIKRRLNH